MEMCNLKGVPAISKIIVGVLICAGLAGCLHQQESPGPVVSPSERIAELSQKNESLQLAVASKNDDVQALGKEVVTLNMKVLEYEAVIRDLKERMEGHQQRLEAAIIEVVRTKARLRSLESKAEAASTIAEAEIAVNALKKETVTMDEAVLEEVTAAENLLKMSVSEFKGGNFGGALFLANQSKGQVRVIQLRRKGGLEESPVEDERKFSSPLHLKVLTNCNLRKGPGLDNEVVGKLGKDAWVTGLAYSGRWLRVETAEGNVGWLFQPLVGPR
ncbi:MAG: hypothetical protein P8X96_00600 [Desulfobacteraceae bacterium]